MEIVAESLGQALDRAVDELERLPPSGCSANRRFLVKELEQHDANWLVSHILADRLIEKGFEVYRSRPDSCYERLSYRVAELKLNGQGSLRGGTITRTIRAEVALRLTTGPADSLLWRAAGRDTRRDRFSPNALPSVQNDEYDFAKFEVAEQSWNKFVEPLIVSSVLGVLVYLFFSNR